MRSPRRPQPPPRRSLFACSPAARWAVALVTLLASVTATVPSTAAAPAPVRYVAMGDSAASGAGVPPLSDLLCLRSANNYPHHVARRLHPATFTDVTCQGAGATTLGTQLAALSPDTTLVTLTIGAQAIAARDVILKCTAAGALVLHGSPCRDSYRRTGQDELHHKVTAAQAETTEALHAIRRRAPRAQILLVGYLKLFPADGPGCRPRETFADGDRAYLSDIEEHLNTVLARSTRTAGAKFINLHPASTGHTICTGATDRWVEGLLAPSPAQMFHPNLAGHQAVARHILDHL
ncbi:SGNH/GDSL hydrolase family protein [Streptomyces syringium]|uniref:SGNH/GDSL hydrolase family protein n=1 Tax=Streptomyces syringium TaxID=76729 RepID=UPI003AAD8BDD